MSGAVVMLIVIWTSAGLAYDLAGFATYEQCRIARDALAAKDGRFTLRLCLPPETEKELP